MQRHTTYDKLIEACLIFLIIFTPFAYGAVLPWTIAVFEVTAGFMALLWFFKMLANGKFEFVRAPLTLFIFLFIGYVFLQFLLSQNTVYGIRNTVYGIQNIIPGTLYSWATKTELLKVISYALIFLVTLNTVKTERQIRRVLFTMIFVGFLLSLCYLMRYFGVRAPTGIPNRDHFSAYLGMIIPLALGFLFIRDTGYGIRFPLFFSVIIMSVTLFFTMSRGGMISFIAALLALAGLTLTRRSIKKKGRIIFAVMLLVISVIVWMGAAPLMERILSIKAEVSSLDFGGRLFAWKGTAGIIRDYALFGTGLGTFNHIFPKYQPHEIITKHYTHAHSDILELISETGIPFFLLSVVCGLWSVAWLYRRFCRRHNPWVIALSVCFFSSLVSIFVHSFADFNLHKPVNAVLLSMILALFIAVLNSRGDHTMAHSTTHYTLTTKRYVRYPSVILVSVITIAFMIACIRPALADYFFRHTTYDIRNTKIAIKFDPTNAKYHHLLGKVYLKQSTQADDREVQVKHLESSIRYLAHSLELEPINSKYQQSLAWASGQLSRAKDTDPQDATKGYPEIADSREMTIQQFESAIRLEPNNAYRYRAYALWLLSRPDESDIDRGVEEYKRAVEFEPKLSDEALQRYFKEEKRYKKLKRILPNTPENHYKIMVLLIKDGLWEKNEADFLEDMRLAAEKFLYFKAISQYNEKNIGIRQAVKVLEEYLATDPTSADAHFYLADRMLYVKPVDWSGIFRHHEEALALDPDNVFYREWYARYLFLAKRHNDAISEIKIALEKDPWNVGLYELLGDWLSRVGNHEESKRIHEKALRVSRQLAASK
ncbi:O-antigen ligase family protein [Candidatus Omnitrophota bacterium]